MSIKTRCSCGAWCIHKPVGRLLALWHPSPHCPEFMMGKTTRYVSTYHGIYTGVLGNGIYTPNNDAEAAELAESVKQALERDSK
jgi:hypothetical protein